MASNKDKILRKKQKGKEEERQMTASTSGNTSPLFNLGKEIRSIDIELIVPNEKNLRSEENQNDLNDLSSLINNIYEIGLQQNLVVYEILDDKIKKYKILSGHRRYAALSFLHEKYPNDNRFKSIPCIIEEIKDDPEKGIDFDLSEKMYIASTNIEIKDLNRRELLGHIKICIDYYTKKNSDSKSKKTEAINQTVEALKISRRKIYSLIDTTEHLIEPLREAFLDEKIQVRAANMLAKLDGSTQKDIFIHFSDALEELNESSIKHFLEKEVIEKKVNKEQKCKKERSTDEIAVQYDYPKAEQEDRVVSDEFGKRYLVVPKQKMNIPSVVLEDDLRLIAPNNILEVREKKLSKTNYRKYVKAMNMISKQFVVIADLLSDQAD